MNQMQRARLAILAMCYNHLRSECQPGRHSPGWLREREIREAYPDEASFHLEVLLRLGHLERDGLTLRITGDGIREVEASHG